VGACLRKFPPPLGEGRWGLPAEVPSPSGGGQGGGLQAEIPSPLGEAGWGPAGGNSLPLWGRAGWGLYYLRALQRRTNAFQDSIGLEQNIVVPEPQDPEAVRCE